MISFGILILLIIFFKGGAIKKYVIENFGTEYLPKDYNFIFYGLLLGLIGGIVGSFFDLQGKGRATDSDEVIMGVCVITLLLFVVTTIVMIFISDKSKGFWIRYLCNSFLAAAAFFPGVLIGSLLMWIGVIILLGGLAYFGINGAISSMGSAAGGIGGAVGGSGSPVYKCCASCVRFSYGKCNDNPSEMISQPNHHSCGGHQFK